MDPSEEQPGYQYTMEGEWGGKGREVGEKTCFLFLFVGEKSLMADLA